MPSSLVRSMLVLATLMLLAPATARAQDTSKFDQIVAETAKLRGLPVKKEIVQDHLTRQELEERLRDDLATDYPPDEIAADDRALEAFGLIPEKTDLGQLVLALYTEQIAGFYDPETDEMYVIGDGKRLSAEDEFTYSHEIIHALQDQSFDLEAVQAPVEDGTNDDQATAIVAMVEGDAVLGSVEYVLAHPVLAGKLALVQSPDSPQFDSAPPVISQSLLFPYTTGQAFVAALREDGGWDAVNAAYADPPDTTEQVMHPEKYLKRDDPTPVTLPSLASALGTGWTKAEENNFGEFQTAVLLSDLKAGEGFDAAGGAALPVEAMTAAAGWDGDRYAVWAKGGDDVVVWQSVWDSADDATEFSQAMQAHDAKRFDSTWEGESPDDIALETAGTVARIVQHDETVTYVLAPTLKLADAAIAGLPDA